MGVVLGVDSSTQSTKAELRRAERGELLWSGANPHPPTTPPRSEQDPHDWWRALAPLLRAAGDEAARRGERLDGVSVAAQQHGMVALDSDGEVVRPAKLWNDTESAPDAAELVARLGGPEAWAAACGSVPGPAFTVSKLAWLRRCEPASFARLARVCLPHDWLTLQLCGELVTDRGDASGTGYFSVANGGWAPSLLELVGLDESVTPRLVGPLSAAGECVGWAGAEVRPAHGVAGAGTVVAPGTGDNMAAALGIGLRPHDVAVSIGTSGTVYAVTTSPTCDASGAVAGFADATGRYLPLVCTLNAAKVTVAVARWLGVDRAGFDRLALEAAPGAGGVVLVPYFDGERTPSYPFATGALSGLRSDTDRAQIARAAVEGVVCGLLDGLDALHTAIAGGAEAIAGGAEAIAGGAEAIGSGRLLLVGGGARSAAYRSVLADVSGRAVTAVPDGEHVATGVCVQAAAVSGERSFDAVFDAWGPPATVVVEPDPDVDAELVRAAYRAAQARI